MGPGETLFRLIIYHILYHFYAVEMTMKAHLIDLIWKDLISVGTVILIACTYSSCHVMWLKCEKKNVKKWMAVRPCVSPAVDWLKSAGTGCSFTATLTDEQNRSWILTIDNFANHYSPPWDKQYILFQGYCRKWARIKSKMYDKQLSVPRYIRDSACCRYNQGQSPMSCCTEVWQKLIWLDKQQKVPVLSLL